MSCCCPGAESATLLPDARASGEEVLLASRIVGDGLRQIDLSVPTIHCGARIGAIEKALGGLAGVESARVNLSTKRVTVGKVALFDSGSSEHDSGLSGLIRALAVAGFAASNRTTRAR
jgi:Cu2+-exporting ATPase